MIVLREIERRPLRFSMSTIGIAMGVGIFLFGRFSWDSFDRIMSDQFLREHREDITVSLRRAQPESAVFDLAVMPGILIAEGERVVGARVRFGTAWRDIAIHGMPGDSALRTLLDGGTRPVPLPEQGVIITKALADLLGVHVGDDLEAEILEGAWITRDLLAVGVAPGATARQLDPPLRRPRPARRRPRAPQGAARGPGRDEHAAHDRQL